METSGGSLVQKTFSTSFQRLLAGMDSVDTDMINLEQKRSLHQKKRVVGLRMVMLNFL